jgi:CysZ protein
MYTQIKTIVGLFLSSVTQIKSDAVKYLFYSGLLALSVFAAVIFFTWKFAGLAGDKIAEWIPWTWAQESMVFAFVVGLAVIVLAFMLLKYILLILMSPLLSVISEKAEKQMTGMVGGAGFSFARSTFRSGRINMRNMLKELVFTVLLLIVGFLPGINVIVLPLIFVTQAYFTGFGIMDFYLERHYTFSQTITIVYKNKWAAVALGTIFMTLFLIPVVGVIVAPYFTTVSGTRYFISQSEKAI